jgi:hypothetical protein
MDQAVQVQLQKDIEELKKKLNLYIVASILFTVIWAIKK